jgi:hypothetical protein
LRILVLLSSCLFAIESRDEVKWWPPFFVTVADDLEEHGGTGLIEAEITDFVDDKEPWLGKDSHGVGKPVLFEGGTKTTCQFHGGEEEEAVSEFGGEDAEGDGEMGFADSGRTQEQNIASFAEGRSFSRRSTGRAPVVAWVRTLAVASSQLRP